ncbi:uncharacterized protein LOC118521353 isoform X2 [Halichoerus grypus]
MGTCSEDPHPCGAPWPLGFTSLLLSVCSAVTQSSGAHASGVEASGIPVSLKGTQGASVWFHVIGSPELPPEVGLEKISWGIVSGSHYIVMLHVFPGRDVPEWVNFQDKFEKRVHVLNITTLRIDNLTLEDSGRYRAQESYRRGRQHDQDFHLRVYGWCNVTVECDTTGTREDLNVSWESEGLPKELEQRPSPGPAPNPWTLAVNLPLGQPSPSLTCVVSNQVDQKTATLDLGDVCGHDPPGQAGAALLGGILGAIVVVLLILGAGLYLWKRRGKKKNLKPGRGRLHFPSLTGPWTPSLLHFAAQGMSLQVAAWCGLGHGGHGVGEGPGGQAQTQAPSVCDSGAGSEKEHGDPDDGIHYAELSQQEAGDNRDKGRGVPHLEEETSLTTVYSEVHRPGQAMSMI